MLHKPRKMLWVWEILKNFPGFESLWIFFTRPRTLQDGSKKGFGMEKLLPPEVKNPPRTRPPLINERLQYKTKHYLRSTTSITGIVFTTAIFFFTECDSTFKSTSPASVWAILFTEGAYFFLTRHDSNSNSNSSASNRAILFSKIHLRKDEIYNHPSPSNRSRFPCVWLWRINSYCLEARWSQMSSKPVKRITNYILRQLLSPLFDPFIPSRMLTSTFSEIKSALDLRIEELEEKLHAKFGIFVNMGINMLMRSLDDLVLYKMRWYTFASEDDGHWFQVDEFTRQFESTLTTAEINHLHHSRYRYDANSRAHQNSSATGTSIDNKTIESSDWECPLRSKGSLWEVIRFRIWEW